MRRFIASMVALLAFALGTAQAQQPVPKGELGILVDALRAANHFNIGQNLDVDVCLSKGTEVDKIICLKQMIDDGKAKYVAMLEKVAKVKAPSTPAAGLLKGAHEIFEGTVQDAKEVRADLEACSRTSVVKEQLSCFQEVKGGGYSSTVLTAPLVSSVVMILEALVQ